MYTDFNILALLTIIIGIITLILLVLDTIPMESISIGLLGSLIILFVVFPGKESPDLTQLLSGFANPGLISVMALLVLAEGLVATGALAYLASAFRNTSKYNPTIVLSILLIFVAICSSVMNNTPVVVVFIPLVAALSEHSGINISKALMPLSYIGMLGGMTTLMGSSTNLIGAGIASELGVAPIGMLDISIPALYIAIPGIIFVITIMPYLMPKPKNLTNIISRDARQFLAEIEVEPNSKLIGLSTKSNMFEELIDHSILFIQRGEHAFYPPFDKVTLKIGDIIVVAATRKSLELAISNLGEQFHPHLTKEPGGNLDEAGEDLIKDSRVLAEVIVAPRSNMIDKDLEQIRFRNFTGCIVLGLLRRSRMLKERITEIPLMAGDVLLVQGTEQGISKLKSNTDVVLIDWSKTFLPQRSRSVRALGIFITTIVLAASGFIELAAASLIGVSAMILSKALSINRAAAAIDRRIYITVASMLAYGTALEGSGAASLIVNWFLSIASDLSPAYILSILFVIVTIFTNFLTNNASVIVFMPIAINTAHALGLDPTPFAISIILAANVSFATPFGYQTNLLIMTPGQYKFSDYLRGGIPLTIISWIAFFMFIPKYYGLT